MDDIIDIGLKIVCFYGLLLIFVGTFGNLITFVTCLRPRLRSITTFIFFAFMNISDIIALFGWNLSHFTFIYYNIIPQSNLIWCKISSVLQNVSLEFSAWLLVLTSFDRYLSVRFKSWRSSIFSAKKAFISASSLGLFLFFLHFHLFITNGEVKIVNNSATVSCYDPQSYNGLHIKWQELHGYLYSFIPFTLLAIFNSLIIYQTMCHNTESKVVKSASAIAKRKSMSLTVVAMTAAFILMTFPSALCGGVFIEQLYSTRAGILFLYFCDKLSFSYHSLNFIVFLLFNKQFRLEWKTMLLNYRNRNRVNNFTTTTNTVN